MAQKTVTFSLEESVIKKIEEMSKVRPDIASKSNLVTVAILSEWIRWKRSK